MIVAVVPEDWVEFREIRLRALADAPDAFGVTLAEAQEQTEGAGAHAWPSKPRSSSSATAARRLRWGRLAAGPRRDDDDDLGHVDSAGPRGAR